MWRQERNRIASSLIPRIQEDRTLATWLEPECDRGFFSQLQVACRSIAGSGHYGGGEQVECKSY
jgi:hypothetical protein